MIEAEVRDIWNPVQQIEQLGRPIGAHIVSILVITGHFMPFVRTILFSVNQNLF
jgi:hypothetical protein